MFSRRLTLCFSVSESSLTSLRHCCRHSPAATRGSYTSLFPHSVKSLYVPDVAGRQATFLLLLFTKSILAENGGSLPWLLKGMYAEHSCSPLPSECENYKVEVNPNYVLGSPLLSLPMLPFIDSQMHKPATSSQCY